MLETSNISGKKQSVVRDHQGQLPKFIAQKLNDINLCWAIITWGPYNSRSALVAGSASKVNLFVHHCHRQRRRHFFGCHSAESPTTNFTLRIAYPQRHQRQISGKFNALLPWSPSRSYVCINIHSLFPITILNWFYPPSRAFMHPIHTTKYNNNESVCDVNNRCLSHCFRLANPSFPLTQFVVTQHHVAGGGGVSSIVALFRGIPYVFNAPTCSISRVLLQ